MPSFRYLAKRGPKEAIEGVFQAEKRADVFAHLSSLGYTPVRISEDRADRSGHAGAAAVRPERIPVRQLNVFTRQFASLVRSQVPLLRALAILKEQTSHAPLQRVLGAIAEDVRQGHTLSEALGKHPRVFSPLFVNLTRSGEIAGTLDEVLDRLAAQADREDALRAKVRGALAYPLFVGVVGCGTVAFLLAFVMPRLVSVFQGFGGRLPLPTRILMAVSGWCAHSWFWIVAAAGIGLVTMLIAGRGEQGRLLIDRVSLRLPLLGSMIQELELARFARAFGLLLDHGIPVLQAADVAIPIVNNRVIRHSLSRLPASLKDGGSLAIGLKGLPVVTPFVVHTVAVGEEGGRVGEALAEVTAFYERDVERLLDTLAALLEPVMILMVGAVVGFIVMAVLLPIFEMGSIAR